MNKIKTYLSQIDIQRKYIIFFCVCLLMWLFIGNKLTMEKYSQAIQENKIKEMRNLRDTQYAEAYKQAETLEKRALILRDNAEKNKENFDRLIQKEKNLLTQK